MKNTILLTPVLLFSLLTAACNNDDDGNVPPAAPAEENGDPTVSVIISGDLTDTVAFTIPGGIMNEVAVSASYVGISNLLLLNFSELPTGFSFGFVGNRNTFGEGEFVASGIGGYGNYVDAAQERAYTGTSCTITLTSLTTVQDVVEATYDADGSFSATMEDMSTPPKVIQINGEFANISLHANE